MSIWPESQVTDDFFSDLLCCRFLAKEGSDIKNKDTNQLLKILEDRSIDVVKTEKLFAFDDKAGFSD